MATPTKVLRRALRRAHPMEDQLLPHLPAQSRPTRHWPRLSSPFWASIFCFECVPLIDESNEDISLSVLWVFHSPDICLNMLGTDMVPVPSEYGILATCAVDRLALSAGSQGENDHSHSCIMNDMIYISFNGQRCRDRSRSATSRAVSGESCPVRSPRSGACAFRHQAEESRSGAPGLALWFLSNPRMFLQTPHKA